MKNVLLIANYRKSVGGISGQVDILMKYLGFDLFNTKRSFVKRLILPVCLIIRGKKFDVFHVHGCSYFGFYPIVLGVLIGNLLNKKVVVTYHGGGLKEFINKYHFFVKPILRMVDVLTVPSEYLVNILNQNRINVIKLANVLRKDNVNFLERKTIKPNFAVSRTLSKVYNIPLAIKSFAVIKEKYPEAKLRIIGDGSLKESLMMLVEDLRLKDVVFTGRVDNAVIGDELNKSDVYLNPTTKDSFSLSMFEAFACGLPVISTNIGAISEFLTHGVNGLLVESDNVDEMALAMESILLKKINVSRMVNSAYKTYLKYTWDVLEESYVKLY